MIIRNCKGLTSLLSASTGNVDFTNIKGILSSQDNTDLGETVLVYNDGLLSSFISSLLSTLDLFVEGSLSFGSLGLGSSLSWRFWSSLGG